MILYMKVNSLSYIRVQRRMPGLVIRSALAPEHRVSMQALVGREQPDIATRDQAQPLALLRVAPVLPFREPIIDVRKWLAIHVCYTAGLQITCNHVNN